MSSTTTAPKVVLPLPGSEHTRGSGRLRCLHITFTLPFLHKEALSTLGALESYEPLVAVTLTVGGGAVGTGGANEVTVTG